MTDYPETILAKVDYNGTFDGQWVDRNIPLPPDMDAGHEYIRADLYNTLLTEKHADAECIGSLRAENERLREALRFYSDEGYDGYDVEITDYGISMSTGHIIKDGGDIARAALATPEDAK